MRTTTAAGTAETEPYLPYLTELVPGVHAYLQPDGGWCLNNAGFISDGRTTLLVDTAATERRAQLLRDALLATGAPMPDVVVNTHHHGDHTYGNRVFADGAEIIAHTSCRDEMIAAGHQLHLVWPDIDYGDVPVTAPTITYADRLVMEVGDSQIHLIHPGTAHTTGDTIVWLPGQRVVFAGDLVFNEGAPFIAMGSLSGSLRALGVLRSLDAEFIVPGHGPVCGPEVYDTMEGYLYYVAELAAQGRAAGRTPLETALGAHPGEFSALGPPERLVGNLHRAYAELDGLPPGSPLDLAAVFSDMALMNGGQVPDCRA
jgi:cyclase